MVATKRIVCLANSRKLAGRCIAGREWGAAGAGDWIRPVSKREHGDVGEYERQYEDGTDPRVLDIIDVPVVRAYPKDYQTENWLLDDGYYWEKQGKFSLLDLERLTDPVAPLWVDGHNTYNGHNDCVPLPAARIETSLRLLRVERLELAVFAPGEAFGNSKRRVQGRFSHASHRYALWVTDPTYEREYLGRINGRYQLGACYLTVSLGEPYKNACYKLIAAIIEAET